MKNVYVLANVIKKKKLFKIYLSLEIPKKKFKPHTYQIYSSTVPFPTVPQASELSS